MWTAEQGLWGILLPAEKKTCFGGGRLAIPCGGQRGKRPALGNPSSPGKSGIHAALIFAAAGRWSMRAPAKSQRNSLCECPGQRVAKRNARKEKLVKYVLAPRRPPHHPPRVGSWGNRRRPKRARRLGKIGAGTGTPTPVSAEGHCTGARPSGLFFWTVHGPFSFRARPKRKWGVHPAEQAPCGSKDSRGRRTAALYNSLRSDRPAR